MQAGDSASSGNLTSHDSPAPLAAILDQMAVGVGVFNGFGQLFHSNSYFQEATGGSVQSTQCLLGPEWCGYGDDGSPLAEQDHPVLRALSGHVATPPLEFIRRSGDGTQAWLGISAVPVTIPTSTEIIGAVVVVEDITERRKDRVRARAIELRFRRFAQYSSHAMWIGNPISDSIEYLSPAAVRIWKLDRPVTTMTEWMAHMHPDDRRHVLEVRSRVAEGDVRRVTYRIIDGSGITRRQVRETCFAIPPGPDDEACIGGIVEDVSPEIQLYLVHRPDMVDEGLVDELRRSDHKVKCFSSADQLMEIAEVLNPGCVIVDLRGSSAQLPSFAAMFAARPLELQMIFIGSGDTPRAQIIEAMRAGAVDFLIDPVDPQDLAQAIHAACDALPARFDDARSDSRELADRIADLPRREREVFMGLIAGDTNKMIARTLGISPRTVEVHRAHLMERLNVKSLSKLLEIAHRSGIGSGDRC